MLLFPLVSEIWSPSTGGYDVGRTLPRRQERGDLELWLVHPSDRSITIWRRRPDGTYDEQIVRGGVVRPAFLPDGEIDLDDLFE